MRTHLRRGATRARAIGTTERDPAAAITRTWCGGAFMQRGPDELDVPDCAYVPLDVAGFEDTAFEIDAHAGRIAGWECSSHEEHHLRPAGDPPSHCIPGAARIRPPVQFTTAMPDRITPQHSSRRR